MAGGILAAFAAAALYNLAVVIEKKQAQRESLTGVRLVIRLFARPLWLFGLAVQLVGLALHVFALTRSPVTVVQPIIAAGIVFIVFFSALVLGERPGPRELLGIATTAMGLALLLASVHTPATMERMRVMTLGATVGLLAVIITALLGAARWASDRPGSQAAVLAGTAAGCAQGMSDAMNRLMGAWLSPHGGWVPPDGIGLAAAGGLVAFGATGLVIAQNALRSYRANTVVPSMLTMELAVPIAVAVALYGQPLPADETGILMCAAALVLILAGITGLASSPHVASKFAGIAPAETPTPRPAPERARIRYQGGPE